jgi:hypothetical protein
MEQLPRDIAQMVYKYVFKSKNDEVLHQLRSVYGKTLRLKLLYWEQVPENVKGDVSMLWSDLHGYFRIWGCCNELYESGMSNWASALRKNGENIIQTLSP